MTANTRAPLRLSTVLCYACVEFPLSMAAIPMAIFIPAFYTRDLGLPFALAGAILMAARISDVVTDPLAGYLSDRTRTPIGRRKPWVLAGAPILLVSVYQLFIPGPEVGAAYFAFWVILLWLGWTMVAIPYYAWGAELSSDYHERTRIATWRTMFGVAGTLTAIVLPLAIAYAYDGYGNALSETLRITAHAALPIATVAVAVLLWRVPEGRLQETQQLGFVEGLRLMWANGPFKRLMLGFMVGGIGPALAAPLYVLYVNHVIEQDIAGNMILLVFYAGNLVGVSAWGALSRRIGKRRAWMTGMSMMILSQPWYLTLGPGDLTAMMAILFVGGLGAGSFVALPSAMKADVIDIDRLQSGQDRTGLFFSMWSMANKLILAFAVGFAFWVLGLFDFQASGTNGPMQLLALKVVFAGIPVCCYAAAIAIVWGYSLTEEKQAELRLQLAQRVG